MKRLARLSTSFTWYARQRDGFGRLGSKYFLRSRRQNLLGFFALALVGQQKNGTEFGDKSWQWMRHLK
jgi:hypothetical protein